MAANDGGFLDGISGAAGGSVDGMPLEKQLEVRHTFRMPHSRVPAARCARGSRRCQSSRLIPPPA